MASVNENKAKSNWKISYRLFLGGKVKQKAKYVKDRSMGNKLLVQANQVEQATKHRMASIEDINAWVDSKWITREEASHIFDGFADSVRLKNRTLGAVTDYGKIMSRYEVYAEENSKAKSALRKTYVSSMSVARKVIEWLEGDFPDIRNLTEDHVREYKSELRNTFAPWTINHRLTKLRILIDQAVNLGMVDKNVARNVSIDTPKALQRRTVITLEQAQHLLQVSLRYRRLIAGCVPTVVRLGLYAGLRDEEMVWLKWDAIDFKDRILRVQETSISTGERWSPKDNEDRVLDIKPAFVEYLKDEKKRIKKLLPEASEFVLVGDITKRRNRINKPLSTSRPQLAFKDMIRSEGMSDKITVYSLRHTFATMALRSGIDLKTLQARMGHADIRTTEAYLHMIEPSDHPMDALPY